jgi:trimethylamine--corrinoid protein Co-methyltransferase
MALSDSKFNDPQAGMETGAGAFLAALAGINSVSGPGMLEYVNCFSLEKLVFDDEVVAHAKRFVRPVEVRGDLPAAELMDELVRDKHLLTSEHTLEHWPQELYLPGPMVDRSNWDQWQAQGSKRWRDRALEMVEETLAAYEEEPLAPSLHAEIQQMFRRTCLEPDVVLPGLEEA